VISFYKNSFISASEINNHKQSKSGSIRQS